MKLRPERQLSRRQLARSPSDRRFTIHLCWRQIHLLKRSHRSSPSACRSGRRVIFLNRFFYPDHAPTSELLSDVAFALSKGHLEIKVITSRQNYEQAKTKLKAREIVDGVDITRVRTSTRGRFRLPWSKPRLFHILSRRYLVRLEDGANRGHRRRED